MNDSNQVNDKIEDSLDNLSNAKLRQSSLQKHRVELIQVKQRFVSLLQKLQASQTRQISLSELKKLIQKNREPDHLRIYLSILKTLKPNHNSTTKEHQVLVISILAKVFKQNLIDPMDKQPTLLKTCFKVVQILLGYFNDTSNTVQQACARVILDLNEFCLEEGKYQKEQKLSVLFAPLISILRNGVDKASQATATVCINELVKFWFGSQSKEYLDLVSKEIFSVILKINSEYHEIFMTAIILIEVKGLTFFENKLANFISKILPIIDGTREGSNNFNSYMCKVNVCKILQKIALLLRSQERSKFEDLNIIGALTKSARNKIIQVQMAASRALKAWRGEPMSEQKIDRNSNSVGKPLRSLQEMREQKKRERSNSKQNTIKIQNELNYMKEDLQKMVKGGWGANNRAKNYIKRGTGVGGGHYGQSSSTSPNNHKSHRQHLEQLRSLIKKGSKQNKNVDKFQIYESKMKAPEIPTSSNNNVNVFMQRNAPVHQNVQQKRNQTNLVVSPVNNIKKQIYEEDEFAIEEDDGDQCVNFEVQTKKPKVQKESNQVDNKRKQSKELTNKRKQSSDSLERLEKQANNIVLKTEEVEQLFAQQNRLQALNFDLTPAQTTSQKTLQNPAKVTAPQKPPKVKDEKFIQRASKIKQNLTGMGSMLTEEQLQELMLENNLSDVSQNISACLNESDFHKTDQNVVLTNQAEPVVQPTTDKNNFTKKSTEKYDESLNYTNSQVTNLKDSLAKNSLKRGTEPMRQQFTLNPNTINQSADRFQSIQRQNNGPEEQIEQDLVESCFQQSRPKQQNMLPLRTKINQSGFNNAQQKISPKPSPKQQPKKIMQEQENEEQSKNYQQLIQNPPAVYQQPKHVDKKSFIKEQSRVQSVHQQQQEDEEVQQSVTDKWIKILSLIENNQLNVAFEEAFEMDDPIYIIRLMIITKTPLSSLTAGNCTRLWDKFLEIYKHNFISILFVQLFTQANDLNLIKNSLTIEEMHDLLVKLYEISGNSKGKLSFNAALLYNKVDQNLRPSKK